MSELPWWDLRMPHDASTDGWRIDEMIEFTNFFVVLLVALTVLILAWVVFRHGKHHAARFDHGASWASWRWTVFAAAFIFFVVDGDLFLRSLQAANGTYFNFDWAEAQPGAVRLEINAHQWAWTYRHAGPDGRFNTADDIVGLNELVVPQGRPVIFELVSTDVIHSFNVPNMRMKVDVVPGQVNRMWFTPREAGVFEISCAQQRRLFVGPPVIVLFVELGHQTAPGEGSGQKPLCIAISNAYGHVAGKAVSGNSVSRSASRVASE